MMNPNFPFDMQFSGYKTEALISLSLTPGGMNGFDHSDMLNLVEELTKRLKEVTWRMKGLEK